MSDDCHKDAAETLKIQIHENEVRRSRPPRTCCREDPYYRTLSICSVCCGCCCIGVFAVINSVRAENAEIAANRTVADRFSRDARKYALISFAVLVSLLVMGPVLMAFISYLVTLRE